MARVRSLAMIIALSAVTGAHWAMLQSCAWTAMLAKNLREDSFAAAVTRTFDGNHPCRMCKAVAAGKNASRKTEFTGAVNRFEFLTVARCVIARVPELSALVPVTDESAASWSEQPPTPPPRAFCA